MILTFTALLLPTMFIPMTAKIKLRGEMHLYLNFFVNKLCSAEGADAKCSYRKSSSAGQAFRALQHARNAHRVTYMQTKACMHRHKQ